MQQMSEKRYKDETEEVMLKQKMNTCFVTGNMEARLRAMKRLKQMKLQLHNEIQGAFISDKKNRDSAEKNQEMDSDKKFVDSVQKLKIEEQIAENNRKKEIIELNKTVWSEQLQQHQEKNSRPSYHVCQRSF